MSELTVRESEVLRLAADGLSNDEIAQRLSISRRTVEAHMHTLFKKTGVSRRSQLFTLFEHAGPTDPDDRRRLELYDAMVEKLVDRQMSLFEERIEITFTVGEAEHQDRVTERRWTTPRPYVVYRMFRPIVPSNTQVDPADLDFSCDVYGQDVRSEFFGVTQGDGQPRMMVLFQPGLEKETEWAVNYRSDGLWDPLRETGVDELTWATVTPERRHRSSLSEMTVRVLFPPDWTGIGLAERDGLGTVSTVERQPSGQQLLVWRDKDPISTFYGWRLAGSP